MTHRPVAITPSRRKRYDGRPCPYCGEPMSLRVGRPSYRTRDHVVPLSRGGLEDPCNTIVVCRACNELKGDLTLDEWLAYLDRDHDRRATHVRRVLAARPNLRQLARFASPYTREEVRAILAGSISTDVSRLIRGGRFPRSMFSTEAVGVR